MMSRPSLLCPVLIYIAFLAREHEGFQHSHTIDEVSASGFVAHSSFPGKPYDGYFGIIATIDVYGYNIAKGQLGGSSIWISNFGDGSKDNFNSIHIGWMVSPEIYGKSHTHFSYTVGFSGDIYGDSHTHFYTY
ncbi:hypothetical protein EJB05_23666, partial [Eragrostis curvula]